MTLPSAALLCLSLAACNSDGDGDSWPPWPTWGEAGVVYTCESECVGLSSEWCYAGPVEDLEALLGESCHAITPAERLWPAFAGCRYACPPEGRGANAHCGEACR